MIKLNMKDGQEKRIHEGMDEPFDYAHGRWTRNVAGIWGRRQ